MLGLDGLPRLRLRSRLARRCSCRRLEVGGWGVRADQGSRLTIRMREVVAQTRSGKQSPPKTVKPGVRGVGGPKGHRRRNARLYFVTRLSFLRGGEARATAWEARAGEPTSARGGRVDGWRWAEHVGRSRKRGQGQREGVRDPGSGGTACRNPSPSGPHPTPPPTTHHPPLLTGHSPPTGRHPPPTACQDPYWLLDRKLPRSCFRLNEAICSSIRMLSSSRDLCRSAA